MIVEHLKGICERFWFFGKFELFCMSFFKSFLNLTNDRLLKNNLSKGFKVAEELTQEQMAEWAYLSENEQTLMASNIRKGEENEPQTQNKDMDDTRNKILDCQQAIANTGLFKSNETSAVACVREFYTAYGTDDDSKVQEAINDIYKTNMSLRDVTEIKELTLREMNMDLKEDFDNGKEYTIRDINKKFAYEVTGAANLSNDAQQAVEILGEKELLDAKVKEKQQELDEFKSPKAKREFVKDRLDGVEKNESLKESLQILKEKEKIEEQIKAKEEQIAKKEKGEEKEPSPEQNEPQPDRESGAEQEDWNKRADELEMQHEKELEDLKDQQSKLEANFQKSIDNLMNSDGINNIITALQEMDRSLEMMLKQGKEESIAKDRQRQEKLDLAFDSPKFKEAVGDLVKDVYAQRKKVKGGFKEMENERANYAKLQTTYEKETKKGLDVKGYEKLKKMMGDIEKETPNFKDSYPKFYQKVNDTLAQTKDKILNKAKGQENENDRGRSL